MTDIPAEKEKQATLLIRLIVRSLSDIIRGPTDRPRHLTESTQPTSGLDAQVNVRAELLMFIGRTSVR